MVSVHPNPQRGQRFSHCYDAHLGGDPLPAMKAAEKNGIPETAPFWSTDAGVEDPTRKVRKPYTITKLRENWTEMEHEKFLEALHLFDRDWKKIKAFVGSKTVIQIRSHAQKHFMKVQKNGMSEHVPPPRPKRKAAHPYPHKAPKKVASQPSEPSSSSTLLDSNYAVGPDPMSVPGDIISGKPLYPWDSMLPSGCDSPISRGDFTLSGGSMNCSSNSSDIGCHGWMSNGTSGRVLEKLIEQRALPDFAQVYRFIGSVFDPSARDHLEELKKMHPIDIETVLVLMNNLSVNLVSSEFENYRTLLSSYNDDIQDDHACSETSW